MRARILRGASQVGGSLVELEHDEDRIALDVGAPLEPVAYRDLMPEVDGLWNTGDGSLKAVFITHGHPDHFGLADLVEPAIPIYMGKGAKSVIDEAAFFTGRDPAFKVDGFLEDGQPIRAGSFTVTPMLVDHSGFDAYGLLVETGGESILYTGDIRFHGRKSDRMRSLPERIPDDLDCLLMEGTNFDRPARADGFETEQELEDHLVDSFREDDGAALCFYSAQNIDRLVTLFRAAKRSGRLLVLDLYGATIAKATGKATIPQAGWDDVRVYVREIERRQVLRARNFTRVDLPESCRIFRNELADDPSRFVMTARRSSIGELANDGCIEGAKAYWSQWAGYLDRDSNLAALLSKHQVDLEVAHVSGHAKTEDLVEFAGSIDAAQTVSIHTDSPCFLREHVRSHEQRTDGEWWPVARSHTI